MLRPTHLTVISVRITTFAGLTIGTFGMGEVTFFPSSLLYLASLGLLVLVLLLFARWQRSAVDPNAPRPAFAAVMPAGVGFSALLIYVVVIGLLQTLAFTSHAKAYDRRVRRDIASRNAASRTIEASLKKENRVLGDVSSRIKRLDVRAQHEAQRALKAPRPETALKQGGKTAAELVPLQRRFTSLNEQINRLARRAFVLAARPYPKVPSPTTFPRWFSDLNGLFISLAQILVALVLALVFSLRVTSRVTPMLRGAMPFALFGLVASLVGNAPELPGNAQALLLGYAIAGIATSITAIGLIATGLIGAESTES